MKIDEAIALANRVLEEIRPFCERCEVAGSIRRRRPEVRDIDIVLIPRPLMWQRIINKLVEKGAKVVIRGSKLARVVLERVQVDLNVASPENWGTILLIRTGSAYHNIRLMNRARSLGLKFSAARGIMKDSKVVASRTEEEIFDALEMDYLAPEDREAGA